MKKLFGLFICGSVALVLSLGSTGCTKDPKKTVVALTPTVTMTVTPTVTLTPTVRTLTPTPIQTLTPTPITPTPTPTLPTPTPTPTLTPKTTTPEKTLTLPPKTVELKAVKIKANEAEIAVAMKGDTKLKIELTEPAPENLTLKAWAKGVDAKALAGTGTIKKGETSGEVTITTVDAPATVTEITVEIAATETTKTSSTTFKTKVK